jgi:hypothetical protein
MPMLRRVFGSVLLALALIGTQPVTTMASPPAYLICLLPDATDLLIVVENFDGFGNAAQHCVKFWKGAPKGIMR